MAKLPPPLREEKIILDYKIGNTRIMIGNSHLDYSLEAKERLIRNVNRLLAEHYAREVAAGRDIQQ